MAELSAEPGIFDEIERLVATGRREEAIALTREVGLCATRNARPAVLLRAGATLERLQDQVFAARFLASAGRMKIPNPLPEWDGSPLTGRTLLVLQRIRHVGAAIRLAQLIPLAAEQAKQCIVMAEPRLVPLFRRSFPDVEVRDSTLSNDNAAEADVVASYETLTQHLASGDKSQAARFTPLRPDPEAVERFRRKYGGPGPLIGICWHSTNEHKDLPSLADWVQFMNAFPATYVSLQYGDVAADLEALRLSGAPVIYDESVDSLKDLDLFAAQIAAMDCVVTISNTGAHTAGALDVPMYILLDDKNHLVWPTEGRNTSWYPSATLIRRENRNWSDLFGEIRLELSDRLSVRTAARTH
jgi:hypothetical protein